MWGLREGRGGLWGLTAPFRTLDVWSVKLSKVSVGLVSLGCWFQSGSLQDTEFRCLKSES